MKDVIFEKYQSYEPKIDCLDHGFVQLLDCMPRIIRDNEDTADYAIAEAARNSYERSLKTISDDKVLIRYLMRNVHTSPFEMVVFKFKMKMPMYICTQTLRHRTASMNILSGRYSKMPNEFYVPSVDDVRTQDSINKQGSDGAVLVDTAQRMIDDIEEFQGEVYKKYNVFLDDGMAREQARGILPYNLYTMMYWKMDLHNLLHFINLRSDHHAQKEIQVYSNAILELIKPIVPWTIEAWEDYSPYRGGMMLTRYEVEAIIKRMRNTNIYCSDIEVENKLEKREWMEKAKRLGLTFE
jgi:thymidylate synthase (FAD)